MQERRPIDDDESVVIAAWVRHGLRRQLEELANDHERTMSGEIRLAIRRHIQASLAETELRRLTAV
jgi:hypothetical protein